MLRSAADGPGSRAPATKKRAVSVRSTASYTPCHRVRSAPSGGANPARRDGREPRDVERRRRLGEAGGDRPEAGEGADGIGDARERVALGVAVEQVVRRDERTIRRLDEVGAVPKRRDLEHERVAVAIGDEPVGRVRGVIVLHPEERVARVRGRRTRVEQVPHDLQLVEPHRGPGRLEPHRGGLHVRRGNHDEPLVVDAVEGRPEQVERADRERGVPFVRVQLEDIRAARRRRRARARPRERAGEVEGPRDEGVAGRGPAGRQEDRGAARGDRRRTEPAHVARVVGEVHAERVGGAPHPLEVRRSVAAQPLALDPRPERILRGRCLDAVPRAHELAEVAPDRMVGSAQHEVVDDQVVTLLARDDPLLDPRRHPDLRDRS